MAYALALLCWARLRKRHYSTPYLRSEPGHFICYDSLQLRGCHHFLQLSSTVDTDIETYPSLLGPYTCKQRESLMAFLCLAITLLAISHLAFGLVVVLTTLPLYIWPRCRVNNSASLRLASSDS